MSVTRFVGISQLKDHQRGHKLHKKSLCGARRDSDKSTVASKYRASECTYVHQVLRPDKRGNMLPRRQPYARATTKDKQKIV